MYLYETEEGIGCSLFADDGAIWRRGRNVEYTIKKIQDAIDNIQKCGDEWGFKFSVEKTKVMVFPQKRIIKGIQLKLYNRELQRVRNIKFLGLCFDEKLTWNIRIQQRINKCKRVLNIMKCLVGNDWGADRRMLKRIYIGLIRRNIDYGSIVYGSAAKTHLEKLDNSVKH